MEGDVSKKNPWIMPTNLPLKEWTPDRVAKLSIWVTMYLAFYLFILVSPTDLRFEWWWGYFAAGLALLVATLSLRVFFKVIGVSQLLIDLIDWATEPHK